MVKHSFLISPGNWLGTGTIGFAGSPEKIKFYARWTIAHGDGIVRCVQTVEVEGGGDQVVNRLNFDGLVGTRDFEVMLENAMLGEVTGSGKVDEASIAWEFKSGEHDFEGYEIYEQQDETNYLLKAEYYSTDQARTTIEGKLWKEGSTD